MKLNILAFGIARDIIDGKSLEYEVAPDTTVESLKTSLMEKYPEMKKLTSLWVAVNSEYGDPNLKLKENDEIALIPPVSGG